MKQDAISVMEIDEVGKLHVVPSSFSFPYIYREAMEVHWDVARRSLHSSKPREWSYSRWFQQILAAAHEQGCDLRLSESTKWLNVDPATKIALLQTSLKS
jgi:hypothetical protein